MRPAGPEELMKKIMLAAALVLVACYSLSAYAAGPVTQLLEESQQAHQAGNKSLAVIKMQEALEMLWQDADIWVAKSVLIANKASGFGIYNKRADNVYKAGQPILVYVEPMGYNHRLRQDGKYEFGVISDFIVKRPSGEILGGKKNVARMVLVSSRPNQEMFLNLTYRLSGAPPGKYVIETVLHDVVSNKMVSIDNEIEIK